MKWTKSRRIFIFLFWARQVSSVSASLFWIACQNFRSELENWAEHSDIGIFWASWPAQLVVAVLFFSKFKSVFLGEILSSQKLWNCRKRSGEHLYHRRRRLLLFQHYLQLLVQHQCSSSINAKAMGLCIYRAKQAACLTTRAFVWGIEGIQSPSMKEPDR